MDDKLTEPTQISALLDIETLDANLYRSKRALRPPGSKGSYIFSDNVFPLTRGLP